MSLNKLSPEGRERQWGLYLVLISWVTSGGTVNSPLLSVCAGGTETGEGASTCEGVVRLQGNLKRAELWALLSDVRFNWGRTCKPAVGLVHKRFEVSSEKVEVLLSGSLIIFMDLYGLFFFFFLFETPGQLLMRWFIKARVRKAHDCSYKMIIGLF